MEVNLWHGKGGAFSLLWACGGSHAEIQKGLELFLWHDGMSIIKRQANIWCLHGNNHEQCVRTGSRYSRGCTFWSLWMVSTPLPSAGPCIHCSQLPAQWQFPPPAQGCPSLTQQEYSLEVPISCMGSQFQIRYTEKDISLLWNSSPKYITLI